MAVERVGHGGEGDVPQGFGGVPQGEARETGCAGAGAGAIGLAMEPLAWQISPESGSGKEVVWHEEDAEVGEEEDRPPTPPDWHPEFPSHAAQGEGGGGGGTDWAAGGERVGPVDWAGGVAPPVAGQVHNLSVVREGGVAEGGRVGGFGGVVGVLDFGEGVGGVHGMGAPSFGVDTTNAGFREELVDSAAGFGEGWADSGGAGTEEGWVGFGDGEDEDDGFGTDGDGAGGGGGTCSLNPFVDEVSNNPFA